MINQQLVDYIDQQLKNGVSRDVIKNSLVSNGWSNQDVIDGFVIVEKNKGSQIPIPETGGGPIINNYANNSDQSDFKNIISNELTINKLSVWNRSIPIVNKVFLVIYLLLVFGLDLKIIIDEPDLIGFWFMMLGVFALFLILFYLENFVFRKKFIGTIQGKDTSILTIIILRNIIFLLNFIPFIQLIGLMLIPIVITLLIIYAVLISRRYSSVTKS